jgi:hypothetical protein
MYSGHMLERDRYTIIGLLLLILVACGKSQPDNDLHSPDTTQPAPIEQPPPPDRLANDEEVVDDILPTIETVAPPSSLDYYHVVVSGSKHLQLPGNKGLLNVWIGNEAFKPAPVSSMNIVESDIIAAGEYALVEANAPDFEVTPVASKCLLLHPSGVDVKFYLTAKTVGDFTVSATVNLYNTEDCSGPAIPKTANTLEVNVVVNEALLNEQRKQGFIDIFWAKATEFWAALLALLFGVILFLVRKHLKKWFGYDQSDS